MKITYATVALFLAMFLSHPAFADTCTERSLYSVLQTESGSFLTDIIERLRSVLNTMTFALFDGIVSSPEYQSGVAAAVTLFIAFFGVSFMLGFVAPTFAQLLIRLLKIGAVAGLVSASGWHMFNSTVVKLFGASGCVPGASCELSAVDWLIEVMLLLGGADPGQGPFAFIEPLIMKVFSPKMIVLVIGSWTSGAAGLVTALLLGLAIFNFFWWIVMSLQIYLVCIMLRTVLLGLGPIFLVMLLFERTKPVFVGWVHLLVGSSLIPIILFMFMTFFLTIIDSAVNKLLFPLEGHRVTLCYTQKQVLPLWSDKEAKELILTYESERWRYAIDREIFEYPWQGIDETGARQPFPYPPALLPVLMFLLLVGIGIRMNRALLVLGGDLGGGSLRLHETFAEFSGWWYDQTDGLFHMSGSRRPNSYARWHQFKRRQNGKQNAKDTLWDRYGASLIAQRRNFTDNPHVVWADAEFTGAGLWGRATPPASKSERDEKRREPLKKKEAELIRYDAALIGFSGAGKSAFFNAVADNAPRSSALRVVTLSREGAELVLADPPGPKKDGMGTKEHDALFLETVAASRTLLHLVDVTQAEPVAQYRQLRELLLAHDPGLAQKPEVVVLTKCDLMDEAVQARQATIFQEALGIELFAVTPNSTNGELDAILEALLKRLSEDAKQEKHD